MTTEQAFQLEKAHRRRRRRAFLRGFRRGAWFGFGIGMLAGILFYHYTGIADWWESAVAVLFR